MIREVQTSGMRRAIRISLILALVLACATGAVLVVIGAARPQRAGVAVLPDFETPVEIIYDSRGVPHIYAGSESDAYRALGYIHAKDRLWQMDLMRRIPRGELAEIFGSDLVEIDRLFRTLRIGAFADQYARDSAPQAPARVRRLIAAYLGGINTHIRRGPRPIEMVALGIQPRPFTESDVVAIAGYLAFSFMAALDTDPLLTRIRDELGPEYLRDIAWAEPEEMERLLQSPAAARQTARTVRDPDQLLALAGRWRAARAEFPLLNGIAGSNGWIVSSARSASGRPVLCNDPHIQFGAPAVWYQAHLVSPQSEVYGFFLAGLPAPLVGHTRTHAWGLTMLQNDDADLYRERVNPDNPDQIRENGRWDTLASVNEVIRVRGAASQTLRVRLSSRGPIINDVVGPLRAEDAPVSLRWGFHDPSNRLLEVFYELSVASTLEAAREAAAKLAAPGLNILYANESGDIARWSAARLPERRVPGAGFFLLNGEDPADNYAQFRDFSANPHSENPAAGVLISANHRPPADDGVRFDGYFNADSRAVRIAELLAQKEILDLRDMRRMQLDVKETFTAPAILKTVVPVLAAETAIQNGTEAVQVALADLKGWDGTYAASARAPLIYNRFILNLMEAALADELGEDGFAAFLAQRLPEWTLPTLVAREDSPWWNDVNTPELQESRGSILARAFLRTVAELEQEEGADFSDWRWGRVHTLELQHAFGRRSPLGIFLNIGPTEVSGSRDTINNMYFNWKSRSFRVTTGPSTRRIVDLANPARAWAAFPGGQSGHFFESTYRQPMQAYLGGEYAPQLMRRPDITLDQRETLQIRPAP